jgi:hypothetical protein
MKIRRWIVRLSPILLGILSFYKFHSEVMAAQADLVSPEDALASTRAIQRFWAVFHGNDYAAIPALQQQLEAALQWDPENVTLTALLGATHFWHAGEYRRDPSPNQSVLAGDMRDAVQLFKKALYLDYKPHAVDYT